MCMCALVETAHIYVFFFSLCAGIVSCTSHRLVVKYVPDELPLFEGYTECFPTDCRTGTAAKLQRSLQSSSKGAKPLWKHMIAAVTIHRPTCSWLEFICYIMKDVFPAWSRFCWFFMNEKAVICLGECRNRAQRFVSQSLKPSPCGRIKFARTNLPWK